MKNVSDLPSMNDENLAEFWDNNEPENFEGWQETGEQNLKAARKRTMICRRQELDRWYKARAANVDRNYRHPEELERECRSEGLPENKIEKAARSAH